MMAEQYLEMFLKEGREHLENLNGRLLELEKNDCDEAAFKDIFDSMNTLKGMSATMKFKRISALSHNTCELMGKVHEGKTDADEELIDLMSRSFDTLTALLKQVESAGNDNLDVSSLLEELEYSNQLEHKIKEQTNEIQLIQKINNAINNDTGLDEVLEIMTEGIKSTFNYLAAGIFLISKDRKYLVVKKFSIEKSEGSKAEGCKIPLLEESTFKKIVDEKEGVLFSDAVSYWERWAKEGRMELLAKVLGTTGTGKSQLHVPLLARGEVVGTIVASCDRTLKEEDQKMLTRFGEQAGIAVQRAKLYDDWLKEEELKKYMDSVKELTNQDKK